MLGDLPAYLLFVLAVIPITVYFNQILFFTFAIYFSATELHKRSNQPLQFYPGVSIIKPLLGIDPFLRENLVSHFELQYPNFEIIFCIKSPSDPAMDVVQTLFREYPNVDARLEIGGCDDITNPMVSNLLHGYETTKYNLVWISTSRIKVNTAVMEDLVRKAEDPSVALIHQLPFFTNGRGFINALEKVCFGCALGRSTISLNFMGMLCFTGMSYLVKKSILDKYGGFASFGKYLAEDFFLSRELHQNGHKILLSCFPAQQNVAHSSVSIYIQRMVRWLRLRLNMLPIVAVFLEPMIECLNLGVLFALSLNYFFGFPILRTFGIHVCVWFTLDYMLLRLIQGIGIAWYLVFIAICHCLSKKGILFHSYHLHEPMPFSFLSFFLAWWTRELLTYVIYLKAMSQPHSVKWGANTYTLSLGGHARLSSTSDSRSSPSPSPQTIVTSRTCHHKAHLSLPTVTKVIENTNRLSDVLMPPVGQDTGKMQPHHLEAVVSTPWRNFPQNGYINGAPELARKLVSSS